MREPDHVRELRILSIQYRTRAGRRSVLVRLDPRPRHPLPQQHAPLARPQRSERPRKLSWLSRLSTNMQVTAHVQSCCHALLTTHLRSKSIDPQPAPPLRLLIVTAMGSCSYVRRALSNESTGSHWVNG